MARYPELQGYVQIGWSDDLKPWGLTVSCWFNPLERTFAWLYKNNNTYYVAKTYEEQVEIHKRYGIPIVPPGGEFRNARRKET